MYCSWAHLESKQRMSKWVRVYNTCFHICFISDYLCPLVFLDAPHILELADVPGDFYAIGGPPRSTDPASTPRAWWRWNTDSLKAVGLQDTLAYLRDRLSAERFDVRLCPFVSGWMIIRMFRA